MKQILVALSLIIASSLAVAQQTKNPGHLAHKSLPLTSTAQPTFELALARNIRDNIMFADPLNESENPAAAVEIFLSDEGKIVEAKLAKSSGMLAWDNAVMRAVLTTERAPDGTFSRIPKKTTITFVPK